MAEGSFPIMPHVFISYVREDAQQVNRLCAELAKNGVEVWLDKNNIKPGARWKDAIRAAIRDGDYFVACFSKGYVNRSSRTKTYMNEELQLALDELRQYGPNRAWFIPVILSECEIPALAISARETLQDIQWVSLFRNWDEGIAKMLEVIRPIPPEVSALMHALASRDRTIRMATLKDFHRINDPRAVPAIAVLLRDEDREAGKKAAELIGKIGGPSAAPALVDFIRDSEPDTRTPPRPEGPEDFYSLRGRVPNFETSVRVAATRALCDLRDPAATPLLIDALKDPEYYVRSAAADALAATRDSAALPALIKYLADPDGGVRANAAKALGGIGDRSAVPSLLDVLSDRRRKADERLNAAEAMGRIGDPAVIPALLEALKEIKSESGNEGAISTAIGAAVKSIGGSSAFPVLFEELRSADATTCERAACVLGEVGDPAAIPALILALKDPTAPIHIHVLGNMLGKIAKALEAAWTSPAYEAAVLSLNEALKDAHAVVRRRAAYALQVVITGALNPGSYRFDSQPGYAIAQAALIEVLGDSDAGVRARAAHALLDIERNRRPERYHEDRQPVFRALTEALTHEDDPRVQGTIIEGLERSFGAFVEREALKTILSRRPPHPDAKYNRWVWESFEQTPANK